MKNELGLYIALYEKLEKTKENTDSGYYDFVQIPIKDDKIDERFRGIITKYLYMKIITIIKNRLAQVYSLILHLDIKLEDYNIRGFYDTIRFNYYKPLNNTISITYINFNFGYCDDIEVAEIPMCLFDDDWKDKLIRKLFEIKDKNIYKEINSSRIKYKSALLDKYKWDDFKHDKEELEKIMKILS